MNYYIIVVNMFESIVEIDKSEMPEMEGGGKLPTNHLFELITIFSLLFIIIIVLSFVFVLCLFKNK